MCVWCFRKTLPLSMRQLQVCTCITREFIFSPAPNMRQQIDGQGESRTLLGAGFSLLLSTSLVAAGLRLGKLIAPFP